MPEPSEGLIKRLVLFDSIWTLFATRWSKAKDAADDDGKFAIGLRNTVRDGALAKLKVKRSISKTMTDEPKRSGDSQQQAARRARRSRGKSRAKSRTRIR
jgi:hypothetical protein